jgi:hypothetical protein
MIDSRTAPYAALLLRVSLGLLFLAHAGLKFFVFTPAGTAKFFDSVGLPPALAYVTIAVEVLGGVALILGLLDPHRRDRSVADPARRHLHGARRGRLLLHQRAWRLGIPGVLERRADRPGLARRRRLCAAHFR